jgi:ABC-type oligopeptide transport system substrate-binding subunit
MRLARRAAAAFVALSLVATAGIASGQDTQQQPAAGGEERVWRHGAALIGEPGYPEGFPHFNYVNPDAPKGGRLRLSATGSFDTLNPLPARGELVDGLNLVYETLMLSAQDEVASEYGLLAEALSYPEDYSSVTFPPARGRPLARRRAGHAGRCRLEFREGDRARSATPVLLSACDGRRGHRRARSHLHLRRDR